MKNPKTAKNMTTYLTLDRELKDIEMQTALVDGVMDELAEGDVLDLDTAGAILVKLESMIFRLRVAMRIFLDTDLPEDDGSLLSQIFDVASEICDMRDELTEVLNEILGDSDEVLGSALAEDFDDEDDIFFVRVPAGSEVLIDGEPLDMTDLPADGDMVAIPLYADESLVVDGSHVNIEDCEPGKTYDIDDEGNLPDASFVVRVPCDVDIEISGDPFVFSINAVDDEGFIPLVLSEDAALSLDGCAVNLAGCEPGGMYTAEVLEADDEGDEDVVPEDAFTLWVPCNANVYVDGGILDFDSDDGLVGLIITADSEVTVDGLLVDLTGCKPGGEYDIAAED